MINLALFIAQTKATNAINAIIYFFKNLPAIKKKTNDQYRFFKLKKVSNILIVLYTIFNNLLWAIIGYLILLVLTVGLNMLSLNFFIEIPIVIFFVSINISRIIALTSNNIGSNASEILELHQLYHFDNKKLAIYFQLFDPIINYIFAAIAIMILASKIEITTLQAILITILFYLTDIICSTIDFALTNNKKEIHWIISIILFVLIIIGLSLLSLKVNFISYPILLSIIVIEAIFIPKMIKYIKSYDKYNDYLNDKANNIEELTKNSTTTLIELKDTDITHEEYNLTGYKMLNKLFFKRHYRLLTKPMLIKTYVLIALVVVVFIAMMLFNNLISILDVRLIDNLGDSLLILFPISCYILYYDKKTTMSMYYNCDNSMLNYQFYRQPKAILTLFVYRYFSILKLISLPFVIVNILLIELYLFDLINITYLFSLVGFNFITYIFFSFFSLLTYYLLQPYTDENGIKSPFYYLITIGIYYLFLRGNKIFNTPKKLVFGYGIICIPLIIIGIIALYYLGTKTFKKQK